MDRPLTEQELVARARRGDGDAYAELVRRHQDVAFRTAMLIAQDAADAEEAAQDAFVKAWRALARFREGRPLRPWLLTIVANEARNRRRSAGRREGLALRAAAAVGGSGRATPEALVLEGEERGALLEALATLREDDRLVLGCRFLLELTEAETAAALGVAPGTVKSRTSRALERLRVALGEEGARMRDLERELRSVAVTVAWPPTPDLGASVRAVIAEPRAGAGASAGAPADAGATLRGGAARPARRRVRDPAGARGDPGLLRAAQRAHRAARATGDAGAAPPVRARGRGTAARHAGHPRTGARPRARVPALTADRPRHARRRVLRALPAGGRPRLVRLRRRPLAPARHRHARAGHALHPEVRRPGHPDRAPARRGDPAVYLAGRPHGFAYVGSDRQFRFEDQRLAGPTLLVERSDGVLVRVEGDVRAHGQSLCARERPVRLWRVESCRTVRWCPSTSQPSTPSA